MYPHFNNIFCIDEAEQGLTLSDNRIGKILKSNSPAIEKTADAVEISRPTLYRAKKDMELKSLLLGFHGKKIYWMLPSVEPSDITAPAEQTAILEYPGTLKMAKKVQHKKGSKILCRGTLKINQKRWEKLHIKKRDLYLVVEKKYSLI